VKGNKYTEENGYMARNREGKRKEEKEEGMKEHGNERRNERKNGRRDGHSPRFVLFYQPILCL
jgi:hypothetical protein